MTKTVRIENADTSLTQIEVEVWEKRGGKDEYVKSIELTHPCHQIQDYITDTRYLVIKEKKYVPTAA